MGDELEKRMYFFVPYNISPIQQAIQAGHSAIEYAREYSDNKEFISFADNWKTWVILNGGTTNSSLREGIVSPRDTEDPYQGTLDNLYVKFIDWNMKHADDFINVSIFQEPDLNNALTAICFIADERVFNYKDYLDFDEFIKGTIYSKPTWLETFRNGPWSLDDARLAFPDQYLDWEESLGGAKNVFLRYLLKGKKLA